jgi:hypothetical protein
MEKAQTGDGAAGSAFACLRLLRPQSKAVMFHLLCSLVVYADSVFSVVKISQTSRASGW